MSDRGQAVAFHVLAQLIPAIVGPDRNESDVLLPITDSTFAKRREVLDRLAQNPLPEALIYVSCFEESFVHDTAKLKELGFQLKNLLGVDQFPFSPHMEWVALFLRD